MRPMLVASACLVLCGSCAPAPDDPSSIGKPSPDPSAAVAPAVGPYQGALRIAPGTATVPATGVVSLRALGGAGAGYAWSLPGPGSGALQPDIGQRVLFTAGPVPGMTETVVLKDSSGGAGVTASVVTTSTPALWPAAAGALSGDSIQFTSTFTGGVRWSVTTSAGSTIDPAGGLYVAGPGH